MTKNLFVCPLAGVTAADVRAFLNLDAEEDARLPENVRLEFKSDWIEDIGEWVAAFANMAGGLLLLGVGEGKGNRPTCIVGVPRKGELKGRIVGHIESCVRPRPRYEVHTLPTADDRDVAIVRVTEGGLPPYMYTRDGKNRVPMRVESVTKPADYLQLDALIRRREIATREIGADPFGSVDVPTPFAALGRPPSYQRLLLRPCSGTSLILHAPQELAFREEIRDAFVYDGAVLLTERSLEYIEFHHPAPEHRRTWRLRADALIGFAADIATPQKRQAELFDLVADAIAFAKLGRAAIVTLGLGGRFYWRHDITAAGLALNNPLTDHKVRGVSETAPKGTDVLASWSTAVDASELDDPADLVARSFAVTLRGAWRAWIDVAQLVDAIRYHSEEIYRSRGRPQRLHPLKQVVT